MFSFLKKPLPASEVVDGLLDMLAAIEETLYLTCDEAGLLKMPAAANELRAFVYILGWYAIQTSELSASDKQRLSAALTQQVAQTLDPSVKPIEASRTLQARIIDYRNALSAGQGRDWSAKLVFKLMAYLDAKSDELAGVHMTIYTVIPLHISAMCDFLSETGRKYKLT